ncbi:MAG: glycoside hydrolase family 2 protein [Anaerolineales bacterium]|nr:glycoside hydrolase family 2 protein [Anaerolineales bacterium]
MNSLSLAGQWQFRQVGTEEWLPATVPGGVHTDLLALGKIPDPFVADNEKKVLWVAEQDWEYRYRFTPDAAVLAEEKVFLVCDGLDTLAFVSLNGRPLGETNNMFRQYRWEIKDALRTGENEVSIRFGSPVQYITAEQSARPMKGVSQAIPGGSHLRKAPCQFGWDWGPMLPPIGIWQDIQLDGRTTAELADVHLRQRHQNESVAVSAAVTINRWSQDALTATLILTAPDGAQQVAKQPLEGETAVLALLVENPQLWWPNGYGAQPLYQVELVLAREGVEIERRAYQLGLRTLELRQDADEWGKSFTFVVNGLSIFAKGSNWIPADSFPTRLTNAFLEKLIRDAALIGHNMLRVWGGGFYEEERFYDLCDRYGILVWQDFIFSCSIYPLDQTDFLGNVQQEVIENVRRLRHRASLALWCGNNEMEQGWESWGWQKPELSEEQTAGLAKLAETMPYARQLLAMAAQVEPLDDWQVLKDAYQTFYFTMLPAWVNELDPDRAYWPSSPSSNTPFMDVNGQAEGDAHYWDVWHGRKPFTAYRDQYPRFMSEFGFQALPPLATVQTYATKDQWNMTSYIMEHHQRNAAGNGLMIAQMTDNYRMPKDFPSLVYMSMVLQAEGIRYGVEHWRRHMDRVRGTLYWQLNDCWPVASWSSLDYFGRWKALHYAAQRFYAPIMLSVEDVGATMTVHVTSDRSEAWEGLVKWTLETVNGVVFVQGELPVMAAPLADTLVEKFDFSKQVEDATSRRLVFVAELWQGGVLQATSVATFVPNKHLELNETGLTLSVREVVDGVAIDVTAKTLARFVELSVEGVDVVFSDNYFDVPAGRTRTVRAARPEGMTAEELKAAFKARSLYDVYA